jgi:predicted nucleic acid-binding protein
VAVNGVVFDTNILIDHLNGIPSARSVIGLYPARSISVVTQIEVLVGIKPDTEARTRALLKSFDIIPITSEVVEAAALLRRTSKLKLPDAVILATAQSLGCVLVTRNTRDFARNDPNILVPYEI